MTANPEKESGLDTGGQEDRHMLTRRVFNVTPEVLWQAWTDPVHLTQWWGPVGFTTTTLSMDMRPGGVWRFTMHGPDGRHYPNRVIFKEVIPAQKLTYTHDDDGQTDIEPISFQTIVLFEPQGPNKTRLTLSIEFPNKAQRDRVQREYGAVQGGIDTVSRLAEHLAKQTHSDQAAMTLVLPTAREILVQRKFDAPRNKVFQALSQPQYVRQWWGCEALKITVCEMDFRPGGAWRIVMREPDGKEHPFKGEFKEIIESSRIVQTFIYDIPGIRDYPSLETLSLEEHDGRTTYTATILHGSVEARDGHLHSGMEGGLATSLDRLAKVVTTIKS